MQSSIGIMDCASILDDLYAVRAFIDSLPMNNASGFLQSFRDAENVSHSHTFAERTNAEQAVIEEKKSVGALLSFLSGFDFCN